MSRFRSPFVACLMVGLCAALAQVAAPVHEAQAGVAASRCAGHAATITGTPGSDVLRGTPTSDVIAGLGGADRISGLGGNDSICAGGGRDSVRGGDGRDVTHGAAGSDVLRSGLGGGLITGGRGNDKLIGGPDTGDLLQGGAGDDSLEGGAGTDSLDGGLGADRLLGGSGDEDLLDGGGTNDVLDGGLGEHDIATFAGAAIEESGYRRQGETVDLRDSPPPLGSGSGPVAIGPDGRDRLVEIEDVIGSLGRDVIYGDEEHANRIDGGAGDDYLISEGPGDVAFGGSGQDQCNAFDSGDSCEFVGVGPPTATDPEDPLTAEHVEYSLGIAGPAITVVGDSSDGSLVVSRSGDAYRFSDPGGLAATGDGCTSPSPTEVMCSAAVPLGRLPISLNAGDDVLRVAGDLPVRVDGGTGTNSLRAGSGDDILFSSGKADVVNGGPGSDSLVASNTGYDLRGGPGADLLVAGPLCYRASLEGGPGEDNASFARSSFGVSARLGGDAFAIGSTIPNCRPVSIRNAESLEGSNFADLLTGDDADNHIFARSGVDRIYGKAGRDVINAVDDEVDSRIDCGGDPDRALADEMDPPQHSC